MNAFLYRKILTPRRLRLDYISCPVCEGDFTSTGTSVISLQPLVKSLGPSGLVMEPWFGKYRLRWGVVRGALCYTVYKLADEIDPFGPYTIVAECIQGDYFDVDEGIYCVTAITPEGETECSNVVKQDPAHGDPPPLPPAPPYVPEDPPVVPPVPTPGDCGQGTPPVPTSLLVELDSPEIVTGVSAAGDAGGSVDFTVPSGRLAQQWVSGSMWQNCWLWTEAWVKFPFCGEQINEAWIVHNGDVTVLGGAIGCFDTNGGPYCTSGVVPACTPTAEIQLLASYPDRIFHGHAVTLTPTDPRVGTLATFTVPALGVPLGAPPSVTGCPAGGVENMNLVRTHGWLPQKASLTIQNFAAIRLSLFCQGSNPVGATQWDGIIADSMEMFSEISYNLWEFHGGSAYVGNCLMTQAVVYYDSDRWSLSIVGDYGSGVTLLWAGSKFYGEDAAGNYGRVGGCSTLGCVTLV
jgi:hypothetical protein